MNNRKYTFRDLIFEVLKQSDKPLNCKEILQWAQDHDLHNKIDGWENKAPELNIPARLSNEISKGAESEIERIGNAFLPFHYYLKKRKKELEITETTPLELENKDAEQENQKEQQIAWNERDIHPLLTYFVARNSNFKGEREILTKTISRQLGNKGFSQWLYPDLVGVYLPLKDWEDETFKLAQRSDSSNLLKFYSFELKQVLHKGNYREAFFQAVSNSSWAHEGYLVAARIAEDPELHSTLERLSQVFGIGIIQLDLNNFGNSRIRYPALSRDNPNWEALNRLCAVAPDFKRFVKDITDSIRIKRINTSEYDEIIKYPQEHIQEHRMTG